MEHNAFTQPFVQHVASDMPAVRDHGRGGDDDVLGERHGVEKGVHRNGRARLIGAIGHDDEQVNVAVGPRVPPCAGSEQDDPLRFEFVGDERDHPGHDRFEGCRSRHRPFRPSTDYTTTVARFPRLRPEHGAVLSAIGAFRAYEEVEPFAHVADLEEIAANDLNLNISRYVDTTEPIDVPSVEEALAQLCEAERRGGCGAAGTTSSAPGEGLLEGQVPQRDRPRPPGPAAAATAAPCSCSSAHSNKEMDGRAGLRPRCVARSGSSAMNSAQENRSTAAR